MAASAANFVVALCTFIAFSENILVSAYYCEWDQCGTDQYCCGDNLCCDYVYSLWYFWVGVVFVVIFLSACGGLFRYCYYNTSPQNYFLVPNLLMSDENKLHNRETDLEGQINSYFDQRYPPPPHGSPPPYSPSSPSSHKHSSQVM